MYGHDKGNGWLYNHALQKVKLFQAFLLQREGQGDMAGPTWAEEYAGATDFEALVPDATMAKITEEAGVQPLDERVNLRARNLQAKRAAMDDPTRAESAESEPTLGGSPKWNVHARRNRKHKADEATVPIEREPFNSLPEAFFNVESIRVRQHFCATCRCVCNMLMHVFVRVSTAPVMFHRHRASTTGASKSI